MVEYTSFLNQSSVFVPKYPSSDTHTHTHTHTHSELKKVKVLLVIPTPVQRPHMCSIYK